MQNLVNHQTALKAFSNEKLKLYYYFQSEKNPQMFLFYTRNMKLLLRKNNKNVCPRILKSEV